MRELPLALAPMGQYKQFIVYKLVPSKTKPGKLDKFPCDFRTGNIVSAHDPQYWTDYHTAIAYAANYGNGHGVGFVFTELDPFWFIDIDGALMPDNTWSKLALDLCGMFNGAAMELSQSGKGLHLFGTGRPPAHSCKNEQLKIEFYHQDRFVALTGVGCTGNAGADFSHVLPALVGSFFAPRPGGDSSEWTESPCEGWRGPADDEELIRRALRSQSVSSAFGNKASFADLWTRNVPTLAKAYPDDGRGYNESQADAALAQHLAFWTGKDCSRILRLMQQSQLVREKWAREDYLPRTILNAVALQLDVLSDKQTQEVTGLPMTVSRDGIQYDCPGLETVTGNTYLYPGEQAAIFKGCVYVRDQHRILIPGGSLLKPEQFKVAYGGYQFVLDEKNEKSTRDSWEALTQNLSYRAPRVDTICFKPDLPPGAIVTRGGVRCVNTFWPVEVARTVGDATPFIKHLEKVLPDQRDRTILLSYMAACVQHMGTKFQWAPLLQGVEGNGKTLFTRCVAEAVGRRYVHWPKASKLSKQFNAWMVGKVFYGVEDIYVANDRNEVIEELKPMITGGDGLEIEGKGVDQISADICGNFMFNSNHKDAVRKTKRDRRYCVLFSAQQEPEDLIRDGMTNTYFKELYNWLYTGGYAIVSELLWTMPIEDEFNPATSCQRAPVTTATNSAILASVGAIEQEIGEAIDQGLPGFRGGWISTLMLDKLLERIGAHRRITHNKRREMLAEMGYIKHPGLVGGRTNNYVLPDNGKPVLFVLKNSPHLQLHTAAEIANQYERDNNTIQLPLKVS